MVDDPIGMRWDHEPRGSGYRSGTVWLKMGFHWERYQLETFDLWHVKQDFLNVTVPDWFLFLLTAILPVWWLIALRRPAATQAAIGPLFVMRL